MRWGPIKLWPLADEPTDDETPEESSEEETDESGEKEEPEILETVMAEEVVPEAEDYGDYEPGTKVKHAIFGIGGVKNSRPKGEDYRLDIDFEDGSSKTLLSTFVDIHDSEVNETEAVVAEPVEVEAIEEDIEAEATIAEPVEAETVLDTDVVYRRPEEDEKEAETVIDLSKPEVQDAEIVDDED